MWLSRNLRVYPQIFMPPIKEIHYFDEKIHNPKSATPRLARRVLGGRATDRRWRRQVRLRARRHLKKFSRKDFLWDLTYCAGAPGDGWYASLFEPGRGRTVGEITPAYFTLEPGVISRVHGLAPDAKIIFMMRNPIKRAWSQAAMQFGKVENRAIDEDLYRHFDNEGSRRRTDYLQTLENWETFYPAEQIFVGFLEDIHFLPERLLRDLYGFLGVESSFKPPNVSRTVYSRSTGTVPTGFISYLARSYGEDLVRLEERFGGYASF